ncbi:MAG: hypothetical protein H2069_00155 [Legionella sp.]|nr:hypothetical protein [Legionella sp.]
MNSQHAQAISHLLFHCGNLQPTDKGLILCNPETQAIAEAFVAQAQQKQCHMALKILPPLQHHGQELDHATAKAMTSASLVISLCTYSLAHSKARLESAKGGGRFLSLPFYNWELLEDPSLKVDFRAQYDTVYAVSEALTAAKQVHVTTSKGTDLYLDVKGRQGNACPGFVSNAGDLGSPPDIEANIAPIEDASEGILVIDGSITDPNLGLLSSPVTLHIAKGRIQQFIAQEAAQMDYLETLFHQEQGLRRVLAECGIGLNPAAKLTGTMLTDEGSLGSVHFGFGSNATIGGENQVNFHLDFVCRDASLAVDGRYLLKEGQLQCF